MKGYIVYIIGFMSLLSCSEHNLQELYVNYNVVLSDSTIKKNLLNTHDFLKFSIQSENKQCEEAFILVYYNEVVEDTIWHAISTHCIFGDTMIDGIKFDQETEILDRIYSNNTKSKSDKISVDFLLSINEGIGSGYEVNMFEIDCQGIFNHANLTSTTYREFSTFTKEGEYCGTYLSNSAAYSPSLELRDGTIEGSYAMIFRINDMQGCKQTYTQFDKIIDDDLIELIPDTMTIRLLKGQANLSVNQLIICDTLGDIEMKMQTE
jgi:hypothetical protein